MTRPSRTKWLLVLVGILLVTNIITLAVFWFNKKPKKGNDSAGQRPRMGKFIVDQMKFDSTREAVYWMMRDTMMAKQRPVWDSIRSAKLRFFDLVNQPGASDSLLRARANDVMEYQKKLDSITLRHFQQVRTLVEPGEVQKFDTVIQEIVNRMTPQRRPNNKDSAQKK
jgi:periplasmic protein CpxP/Spy